MKTAYSDVRRRLAFGTGIGIEIGPEDLNVVIARVRPSGARVLAATSIRRFRERPASEWGAEYGRFVRSNGAAHLSATVLAPRRSVIVRVLHLPGVPERDLNAAIALQVDSLHPYGEDDVVYSWLRVGEAGNVLVAVIRRAALEEYTRLFADAGVRLANLSFSAAVIHPALRMFAPPPAGGFIALADTADGTEIYGESEAHPLLSAAFDGPAERAHALAAAELRLPADAEPAILAKLLPQPKAAPEGFDVHEAALPYAAALAGACPLLGRPLNLLPAELRVSASRLRYAPTMALSAALALCLVSLVAVKPVEDRKYLAALTAEITALEAEAAKAAVLDRAIERTRAQSRQIDAFRQRSKADLDTLLELTKTLQPPTYLDQLELTRTRLVLGGFTGQAAEMLKLIDSLPQFSGSEFTMPLSRQERGEGFRIQAKREVAE